MSRVVVVEENPELAHLYEEHLGGEGYQVIVLRSAGEALEIARKVPISVAVMDLPPGRAEGLEAVRRLLTIRPSARVVLTSTHGGFRSDFRSWLADRCVENSSDLGELRRAVREVLPERAA